MKYWYFVSYVFNQGYRSGNARAEVMLPLSIHCMKQIEEVEEKLKEQYNYDGVAVMNYKLLRTEV